MNANKHPDVTDEDIGRRTMEIRRERAVERALERLRRGCGSSWSELSVRDVERLRWSLGELWSYMPRADWEELRFTSLGMAGVHSVLEFASELASTHTTSLVLDRMIAMLQAPR